MHSYVTLITNDDYVLGARALARSLRATGTRWPLTALALPGINGLDALAEVDCQVLYVDPPPLSEAFQARHSRQAQHASAPFTKGTKPAFHNPLHNFVKLRLWELDAYESVVFLDADTLVIGNIDRLFAYPEFSAAPNLYEALTDFHRLNSGVFVARPARHTFEAMLTALDRPEVFWARTDQTFLQTFFPDWHGLPYIYNTLQYVWFNLPDLWDWEHIRVIHYQYEKPWEENHPRRDQLQPVIEVWWHMLEHGRMPAILPKPQANRS